MLVLEYLYTGTLTHRFLLSTNNKNKDKNSNNNTNSNNNKTNNNNNNNNNNNSDNTMAENLPELGLLGGEYLLNGLVQLSMNMLIQYVMANIYSIHIQTILTLDEFAEKVRRQSINQSINQLINQSINHSIN